MAEHIEIDGIALQGWFEIPDLSPLWDFAEEVGDDAHLPGVDGDRPYPRFRKGTSYSLTFNLRGDLTRLNVPVAGLVAGRTQLWNHRAFVKANIAGRSTATDGTRTLVMYLPDGSNVSADAHVARRLFLAGTSSVEMTGTLTLTIPTGELA